MVDQANDTLQVAHVLKRQFSIDAAKDGAAIRSVNLCALAESRNQVAGDEARDRRKGRK